MTARDRNAQGRAENARPRDGLGRPLPYDSPGVPRVNEDMVLSPTESLREAQHLFATERPFHAHEVLEAAWKNAPAAERALWKALAQLAVGITHVRRGNPKGAAALLHRAHEGIDPYAGTAPHGIRAGALSAHANDLAERITHGGLDIVSETELTPQLASSTAADE